MFRKSISIVALLACFGGVANAVPTSSRPSQPYVPPENTKPVAKPKINNDVMTLYYVSYMMLKHCNSLNDSKMKYISNETVVDTKIQLQLYEVEAKRNNIDTDKIWLDALQVSPQVAKSLERGIQNQPEATQRSNIYSYCGHLVTEFRNIRSEWQSDGLSNLDPRNVPSSDPNIASKPLMEMKKDF